MTSTSPLAATIEPVETFYRIDANDVVVEIGGNWDAFARESNGLQLGVDRILGTNLFDHVSGHFTRRFLRTFISDTRESSKQKRLLYRCDSPSQKRLIEMCGVAEPDGGIRLIHKTIAETALPFELELTTAARAQQALAKRCSMCNRLLMRHMTEWREPDEITEANRTLTVVHTVCRECRDGVQVKRFAVAESR